MKIAKLCAVFILMLAAGCVIRPKPFPISPELKVNGGSAGRGRDVVLEVSDQRSIHSQTYNVPVEGDFAAIVRDSLSQGLQSKGFTIVPAKPAGDHELRVEIQTLWHELHSGMIIPYIQERVTFDLKSKCVVANDVQLEKHFSSQSHWTCCFHILTRAELERLINTTVSTPINELLNDDQLAQCLIEPKQVPGTAATRLFPRRSERRDARIGWLTVRTLR